MSYINAIYIANKRSEYSDNLLPYNSTFENDLTWNITSGTGVVEHSQNHYFQGNKSLKIESLSNSVLNFNTATNLGFTAKKTGSYIFSFEVLFENVLGDDPSFIVNIFKNGVLLNNVQAFYNEYNLNNKWGCYSQTLSLNEDDEITYNFSYQSGYPSSQIIYVDGFKFEFDDKNLGTPTAWSHTLDYCCSETAWQSKVDTINTQNLTADTDNLIAFTGTDSSNGGITLMDSLGKITPARMNDALSIDFVFSFPTPVGTDDYLSVKFIVNGVIYRAQSFNILAPTGETNYVAVSFNLPVETDFFANGGEFYVNPSVNITIANRYIQCTRTHKGI